MHSLEEVNYIMYLALFCYKCLSRPCPKPLRLSGPWDMVGGSIGNLSLEAIGTMGHGLGDLGTLSLETIGTMDGPREIGTLSLEAIGTLHHTRSLGPCPMVSDSLKGQGPKVSRASKVFIAC